VIAAAGPSAYWYLTRGTGLVTLVLLTASLLLGIVQERRWAPAASPRFIVVSLHRAVSLLVVVLLAVHVVTAVLDSFAPIPLLDAVLPFAGSYRPIWLGLGAIGCDLILALTVTSLLRRRLGLRAWRAVHWSAYACWPVALAHGWGTGSDTRTGWMLGVTLACAAAVLVAVGWRLAGTRRVRVRTAAIGGCVAVCAALGVLLWRGPLAGGWARRAGTPPTLLASTAPAAPRVAAPPPRPAGDPVLQRAFSAQVSGTVNQGVSRGGMAVVDLRLRLSGGAAGRLRIRIGGRAVAGGGVLMRRSAVTLGPRSAPGELAGRVDALQGNVLEAMLGGAAGPAVRLRASLNLSAGTVSGTVVGRPLERVG
jgi:DMSO/TMAO reductase YedYZ heme-binding membrane subunit